MSAAEDISLRSNFHKKILMHIIGLSHCCLRLYLNLFPLYESGEYYGDGTWQCSQEIAHHPQAADK